MSRQKQHINQLVHDALTRHLTDEEQHRLQEWLDQSPENQRRFEQLAKAIGFDEKYNRYTQIDEERAWEAFEQKHLPRRSLRWKRVLQYAAAFLLPVLGLTAWLMMERAHNETAKKLPADMEVAMSKSMETGHQKAVLTLQDGKKVELASQTAPLAVKDIPLQDPFASMPNQAMDATPLPDSIASSNSLVTYKDSEYWMTLEDGTQIHLNYSTTLSYPSHFGSTERTVYLKGEAYFQVAKDRTRPFRVVTENGVVKQYGTSFNVNTHTPGETKVVLVKGDISVTSKAGNKERHIKPGELAVMQATVPNVEVEKVDIEPYVAWHNGHFVFDGCTLEELMDVISRWYGKEIVYQSDYIKNMRFTGDLDRYSSIRPVLQAIEKVTGIKAEQNKNKIILREK